MLRRIDSNFIVWAFVLSGGLSYPGVTNTANAAVVSNDSANPHSFAGSVGIGTNAPAIALDARGQSRSVGSTGAVLINGSASVDWNNGNVQGLSAACTTTSLTNTVDGGTYVLAVSDTTATTCAFAQSGLTFLYNPANASRTSGRQTIYTFQRVGSNVFVSWSSAFQ